MATFSQGEMGVFLFPSHAPHLGMVLMVCGDDQRINFAKNDSKPEGLIPLFPYNRG